MDRVDAEAMRGGSLAPEQVSLVVLGVACIAHFWLSGLLISDVALDIDPVNLLYGMREFKLDHFAPHPPGYLVYVGILRGLHAIVGGPPFHTVQLLARLFSTLTIPLVFEAVRLLRPADTVARSMAALLTALHSFLLYHAVDAQTHTAEAFAASLLLVAVLRYRQRPRLGWAATLGLVLAFGSALRPSFVVVGIGPIVWSIGFRRVADLFVAGTTSIVGAVGWLWPTAVLSGGLQRWRAANDVLVNQVFVRTTSLFSAQSLDAFVYGNLLTTSLWITLLVLPLGLAMLGRLGLAPKDDAPYRVIRGLTAWSMGPATVFYLTAFCSEPGYLLGVVPPLLAWLSLAAGDEHSQGRGRVYAFGVAGQLIVLLFPALSFYGGHVGKIPSLVDLVQRDAVYREALTRVLSAVPPDARVLHVSDHVDATLGRQLPIHHPHMHAMIVHSEYWEVFDHTSIGLATQDDCLPIPGEIWLQAGPPTVRQVPFTYDLVIISAFASSDLRAELRKHTTCDVRANERAAVPIVLPASCFKDGTITVHGQGVRFQLPDPPARDRTTRGTPAP